MTRNIPPDKSAGARLRSALERGVTGDKLPDVDPASHSISGEAPLREGAAYLIWWVMIAAVVMGYLLFSKVW